VTPQKSGSQPHQLIIQHVKDGPRWVFRLIVYQDRKTYRPVSFGSLEELLRTLRSAVPNFPAEKLQVTNQAPATYIAYTGEWQMDESQIAKLGFEND
jgi:hypothetical protein